MSPRRVLLISPQPFFQWRGSPIRVAFDAQALVRLGYAVDLLTLPVGEPRDLPGVRVIRVPNLFGFRNVPIGPSFAKLCFDGLLLVWGLALAARHRYAAVHGIEDGAAVGAFVALCGHAKLVFEKHSDPGSYRRGILRNGLMAVYAWVERCTVRRADAVIGTGPGLAEQIRAMRPRGSVLEIGDIPSSLAEADTEKIAAIRAELRGDARALLAAYVGSFAVYQGVDLMFAAIPKALEQTPRLRFAIIGGTAEEIEARRRALRAAGAGHAVTFLGKIAPDTLPSYLAAADLLLSPRTAGVNTPLKLLDYFKAGGAVIATDVAANRLIAGDETAVLTAPDAAAFADGIARAARDAALRGRLARNGRRLIAEKHNFDVFTRELGRCYAAILGDAP